mgnify:CR=1 FL=1|jgi:hypothetical protein
MKNKTIILSLMLIILLALSACTGSRNQVDTKSERFYQGNEGIRMTVENGAPPARIYYYSDATNDNYNAFTIDLLLENVGASHAKGGVYVSGYDPSLIYFKGVNIERTGGGWWEDCTLNANFLGTDFGSWNDFASTFSGFLGCTFDDSGFWFDYTDENTWRLELNNACKWLIDDCPEIDVTLGQNDDGITYGFDLTSLISTFGADIVYHGGGLILSLTPIVFDRFFGQAYMLQGDNYEYPGGEMTVNSFEGEVRDSWPTGLDETDVTFLITNCYGYTTYATPLVCIDPNPASQEEKVCRPGQVKMKSSQGAPVAVTNIEQENTPRSSIFTIEIQNVGNGKIIDLPYLERCSPYYPNLLMPYQQDVVYLYDIRVSGSDQRLDCTQDYRIKLTDGRGQITCTYENEYEGSAYNAPLIMEFWYGYSETQRKNVHIKRVG